LAFFTLIIGFGIFGTSHDDAQRTTVRTGGDDSRWYEKRKDSCSYSTEVVLLAFLGILLGIAAAFLLCYGFIIIL
jgi:hypothetical protein